MKGGGGGGGGVEGGSSLKELFVATRNNFPLILCTASLTQKDNLMMRRMIFRDQR